MHLKYIHRMRGIAIVGVVAVHSIDQLAWPEDSELHRFLAILLQESTTLFFMLAGFLFHHLSRSFRYGDYLQRKLLYVVVPYLIISAPGIAWLLAQERFLVNNPELAGAPWWQQAGFLLFYGGAQINYALWFMPVMSTLFLMAPLFIRMIERPAWFWILIVLIPVALLEQRPPIEKYHHVELTLYYLTPYLLGIWASLNRERVVRFVDRWLALLALAYAALVAGHWWFGTIVPVRFDATFSLKDGVIDWLLVQKVTLFFVLMGLTRRLERTSQPVLDQLGTLSFPIFFLHLYAQYVGFRLLGWHGEEASLLRWAVATAIGVGGSVLIAWLSRLTFGRSSRFLVGA